MLPARKQLYWPTPGIALYGLMLPWLQRTVRRCMNMVKLNERKMLKDLATNSPRAVHSPEMPKS